MFQNCLRQPDRQPSRVEGHPPAKQLLLPLHRRRHFIFGVIFGVIVRILRSRVRRNRCARIRFSHWVETVWALPCPPKVLRHRKRVYTFHIRQDNWLLFRCYSIKKRIPWKIIVTYYGCYTIFKKSFKHISDNCLTILTDYFVMRKKLVFNQCSNKQK